MDFDKITVGLKHIVSESVTEGNTARAMGSGTLPVYATPAMTCLMERAAAALPGVARVQALLALQPEGGDNWLVGVIRRYHRVSEHEARVGIEAL